MVEQLPFKETVPGSIPGGRIAKQSDQASELLHSRPGIERIFYAE